jgi:Domain of unknown function (DUF4249)
MKNTIIYAFSLAAIAILLLILGCGVQAEKEISVPQEAPTLALFANIERGSKKVEAYLTRTRSVGERIVWDFNLGNVFSYDSLTQTAVVSNSSAYVYDTVRNVQMGLYRNGQLLKSLIRQTKYKPGFYSATLDTPINDEALYQIKASASGFPSIEAEQTMPSEVIPDTIFFKKGSASKPSEIVIDIPDIRGINNYYAVDIYVIDTNVMPNISQEKVTAVSDPGAINPRFLSDKTFDGQKYRWRVGVDFGKGDIPKSVILLLVVFKCVTKDYDAFEKSYSLVRKQASGDSPFAEPFSLYSNVKNGNGIFIMSSKIIFKEIEKFQ